MTAPLRCWLAVKVKDDDLQLIPSGLTPRWLPLVAAGHHFKLNGKMGLQDAIYWSSVVLKKNNQKNVTILLLEECSRININVFDKQQDQTK